FAAAIAGPLVVGTGGRAMEASASAWGAEFLDYSWAGGNAASRLERVGVLADERGAIVDASRCPVQGLFVAGGPCRRSFQNPWPRNSLGLLGRARSSSRSVSHRLSARNPRPLARGDPGPRVRNDRHPDQRSHCANHEGHEAERRRADEDALRALALVAA